MRHKVIKWSEFSNQNEVAAEQIVVSVDRNKSKRVRMWASQSGIIQLGKLKIRISSFGIGIGKFWHSSLVCHFHQDRLTFL